MALPALENANHNVTQITAKTAMLKDVQDQRGLDDKVQVELQFRSPSSFDKALKDEEFTGFVQKEANYSFQDKKTHTVTLYIFPWWGKQKLKEKFPSAVVQDRRALDLVHLDVSGYTFLLDKESSGRSFCRPKNASGMMAG